ncbi:penicillin-binding transpeptidase domain-containing protein [Streptacidiphilus sp. PAMC 29251]
MITTCVALLGAGGYGAYNFVHAVTHVSGTPAAAATAISTTPPSSAEALKRAQSFLDSWKQGPSHYAGAASQTNDPTDAQAGLTAYGSGLKLASVAFSGLAVSSSTVSSSSAAGTGEATQVTFTVTAKVAGGTWTYSDALDVLQNTGGLTSVDWAPSVLYPKLEKGQTLAAGAISVAAGTNVTVVDRKGVPLTAAKYPSLTDIVNQLKTKYAAKATGGGAGGAGTGVDVVDSSGTHVANVTTFTAPVGAKLYTTLDAKIQAQAERAVKDSHIAGKSVGVVAIDHASGGIRAIAFSGEDGDIALQGYSAPGSTMKIITAAALIDKGGKSPGTAADCTPTVLVGGRTFQNMEGSINAPTMKQAFAQSCNTAFIRLMDNAWGNGPESFTKQSDEAKNVFGIGDWSIGVPTQDPKMDPPAGTDQGTLRIERAGDAIGQGDIAASPLVIASIGATVAHGGFKQPILIPGLAQQQAASPINQSTAQQLRQMMVATAQGGTAAPRLGGMGSSVGAKTGTAEVGQGKPNNGWFVAYDNTLSIAAEVVDAHSGTETAGYVVADILKND